MITKRLTTAALVLALMAAMPGVALAQESTTAERQSQAAAGERTDSGREAEWVTTIKARALEAIDKRLATIDDLGAAIDRSETVAPDHATQLLVELRNSEAGLESLGEQIRAAEDLETLRVLVPKIFEDFRIYAVVAPKVHLVLAADAAGAVAGRLDAATETLGGVLGRLKDHGIDVAEGEELLAEMERLVAAGSESAAAVPGMVLDLTPADYPGSTETLRTAHSVLQGAGTDLRAAGQTAHEIARFIKSVIGVDAGQ